MLSSARRHCRAHGASTWLGTEGMSHRCWGSQVRCSSSYRTAALQSSSQHASRLHAQLRPCTKCTNNHWFPLKYVQRQSCWSHLCYPEVGALTEGAGEGKVLHFPLLCLEGSNTIFLRCLTHQSVGETGELTGLGVCGNHREGLSSPSHEDYTETLCDSLGRRERDMGTVRQDPHVPLRYSFVLDSLRVGGEEEHDSLTQQVGHSYGGERCGYVPISDDTAVTRQLLVQNIDTARGEGRALLLSAGHGRQRVTETCTRWNFSKNRGQHPKRALG